MQLVYRFLSLSYRTRTHTPHTYDMHKPHNTQHTRTPCTYNTLIRQYRMLMFFCVRLELEAFVKHVTSSPYTKGNRIYVHFDSHRDAPAFVANTCGRQLTLSTLITDVQACLEEFKQLLLPILSLCHEFQFHQLLNGISL